MKEVIGYARVSTRDQSLTSQINQLKEAGCTKFFLDRRSGKDARECTELGRMLEYV